MRVLRVVRVRVVRAVRAVRVCLFGCGDGRRVIPDPDQTDPKRGIALGTVVP